MTAATDAPRMTCVLRRIPGSLARCDHPWCRRPTVTPMEPDEMRRRVGAARVARLATVTVDGRPHIVPCCFALRRAPVTGGSREVVYSAVDAKPKSTTALRRLDNLRANPHAALLVDHYSDDWSTLWWVRVDGEGRACSMPAPSTTPRSRCSPRSTRCTSNNPRPARSWRSTSRAGAPGRRRLPASVSDSRRPRTRRGRSVPAA